MYRFSYKVNKRRRIREQKRESVRHLIASDSNPSNDNFSDDKNELFSESQLQEQQYPKERVSMTIDDDYVSPQSCINYADDDANWINDDEYEDDSRPLYNGSPISISEAIRRISSFYLNINLDKQKVNKLLHLIKYLLPKQNLLSSTWKGINRALHPMSSTSTSFLCCDCYQSFNTSGPGQKLEGEGDQW